MRVVLHDRVPGVGNRGDIVEVADGYGRNFLIPKGLAAQASSGVEAQAKAMRKAWEQRNAQEREAAEEAAKRLVTSTIEVTARAGAEGKLFGSVSPADVAEAIAAQTGIEIGKEMVVSAEPIRTVGSHSVTVQPHPEVQFPVVVTVTAE